MQDVQLKAVSGILQFLRNANAAAMHMRGYLSFLFLFFCGWMCSLIYCYNKYTIKYSGCRLVKFVLLLECFNSCISWFFLSKFDIETTFVFPLLGIRWKWVDLSGMAGSQHLVFVPFVTKPQSTGAPAWERELKTSGGKTCCKYCRKNYQDIP